MTGILKVEKIQADRIQNDQGKPIELLGQIAAKARLNYTHTPSVSIRDSLNISGIVDHGTGHVHVNYITPFVNDGYSIGALGQTPSTNVDISGYYGTGRILPSGIRLASIIVSGSSYLDVTYATETMSGELA